MNSAPSYPAWATHPKVTDGQGLSGAIELRVGRIRFAAPGQVLEFALDNVVVQRGSGTDTSVHFLHPDFPGWVVTTATADEGEPDCIGRIAVFIGEADAWLDAPPKDSNTGAISVTPLRALVKRHFPMHGCDAARFTDVVRTSKYFWYADENPAVHDEAHKRVAYALRSSLFEIYFGIHKQSGSTSLEAAMVRKD